MSWLNLEMSDLAWCQLGSSRRLVRAIKKDYTTGEVALIAETILCWKAQSLTLLKNHLYVFQHDRGGQLTRQVFGRLLKIGTGSWHYKKMFSPHTLRILCNAYS